MRFKKIYILLSFLIIYLFINSTVFADQTTKHQKLLKLMNLIGVKDIYKTGYQLCRKQCELYSPDNIKASQPDFFGNIDYKHPDWQRILSLYKKYTSTVCSYISEKELIELYASLYGEHVTEKELDSIIKFYQTPIGQKDIKAGLITNKRSAEILYEKSVEIESKAYDKYMQEIFLIISKHKEQ